MRRGVRCRAALRQNKHVNDIISQNRARVKNEGDHTLFAYSEEAHSSQTDAYQIASLGTGPSQPTDQNRKSKIKPPSGLRGKELGLWFRDRNREKQAKERESRKKNDLIYPVKLNATVASEIFSVLDRQKIDLARAVSLCGSKNFTWKPTSEKLLPPPSDEQFVGYEFLKFLANSGFNIKLSK